MNAPLQAAPAFTDENDMVAALRGAIDTLHQIVEQETGLVRSGNLKATLQLEQQKTAASRSYVSAVTRAQRSSHLLPRLRVNIRQALQDGHARLRDALQLNMTVLATAHAVSEAVVRGVNSEVQKRTMPQTYTAYGQRTMPNARHVVPIAVSRTM